jgi:hypothetical protein
VIEYPRLLEQLECGAVTVIEVADKSEADDLKFIINESEDFRDAGRVVRTKKKSGEVSVWILEYEVSMPVCKFLIRVCRFADLELMLVYLQLSHTHPLSIIEPHVGTWPYRDRHSQANSM